MRQGLTHNPAFSGAYAWLRRTIELFAAHYPHDYPEVEALVLAARSGLRIDGWLPPMRALPGRSSTS